MDAKTYFTEKVPAMLEAHPDKAREANASFAFDITGDGGGQWTMDLKADPPTLSDGVGEADCTITMANEDFEAMMANFQLAMQFFFTGKLKVSGDPMLATKLQNVLKG